MAYGSLHVDIVTDILSRLPARSIVRFRCVCRQWNSITYDPYFLERHQYHMARSPWKILFFCKKNHNKEIRFHDLEIGATQVTYSWSWEIRFKSITESSADVRPLQEHVSSGRKRRASQWATLHGTNEPLMSNIVNGLVCVYNLDERVDRVYLLNPFTRDREPVKVPRGRRNHKIISYGLGCDVSNVNYKLVRISLDRKTGNLFGQVLTLGTQEWRHIGKVLDRVVARTRPVYASGTLYWRSEYSVLTFGVKEEKLGTISMLSFFLSKPWYFKPLFMGYVHLCGWRGNLYAVLGTTSIPYLTVMAREEADGGEWIKLCDIDASSFLKPNWGSYDVHMIGIEDEKIMLVTCDCSYNSNILVLCYDTRRRTLSKLHDDRGYYCNDFDLCVETLRSPKVVLTGNGNACK